MTKSSEAIRHYHQLEDVRLSFVERHRHLRDQGPTLLFVHATGFHARIWDQLIQHLPDVHSICVDLRGHGRSDGGPFSNWSVLGTDIVGLIEALELRRLVLIGHSIGGHALTQTAADIGDVVQSLILIDPVIMPPDLYLMADQVFPPDRTHPASKRKRSFSSAKQMMERFRDRSPYSLFTPAVLRDYCEHALLRVPGEPELVLACSPETEASAYQSSLTNTAILDCPQKIECPVVILRGKTFDISSVSDFTRSPTWPDLASCFSSATDISRPDLSHFMPMEAPDYVAEVIVHAANLSPEQTGSANAFPE